MVELKELNSYNFITDLIFHPEHAAPKDQKKSLAPYNCIKHPIVWDNSFNYWNWMGGK